MKYYVSGYVTVSCWTEVEAPSAKEAISIAEERNLADINIDGGYPIDECWHIDNDGEPTELTASTSN